MNYADTMAFLHSLGAPRENAKEILGAPLAPGTDQALDAWAQVAAAQASLKIEPSSESRDFGERMLALTMTYSVKVAQAVGIAMAVTDESLAGAIQTAFGSFDKDLSESENDPEKLVAVQSIHDALSADYIYQVNLEGSPAANANARFSAVVISRYLDVSCPLEGAEEAILASFVPAEPIATDDSR